MSNPPRARAGGGPAGGSVADDAIRGAVGYVAHQPVAAALEPVFTFVAVGATATATTARASRLPGRATAAGRGSRRQSRARPLGAGEGPGLEEALAAIERHNERLRGFCHVDPEPPGSGPLIGVKDVIDVAGMPTRAGSDAYFELPGEDAAAVASLRAAGARILGKTETHEFALGVTSPQCRNPVDPERLAGGSSGGSAVAVASGMCWASLATDTRASSRVPAALCGVVGFKPTFGVVPTAGIVVLAWTMDHVAVITSSVADAAALFDVLVYGAPPTGSGRPAAAGRAVRGLGAAEDRVLPIGAPAELAGVRIGVPKAGLVGCDDDVLAAFDAAVGSLAATGADLVELDRPHEGDLEEANHLALLVSRCEAAAYHGARGTDLARCTAETAEQLRAAGAVSARDYLTAQRLRRELAEQLARAFHDADVTAVALPTVPVVAPRAENPERYLLALSRNTSLWSLTGFPAISIPVPARHLPVGLQLVGLPFTDHALLGVAGRLEEFLRSHRRPPPQRKVR